MADTFTVCGPGIISGPWHETQYQEAMRFIDGLQEALGLPSHKLGDWLIIWH